MILVFLAIYIIHALLLILLIQYFLTDAIMYLCTMLFYSTEFLIQLILQLQQWIAGDHIILQHLLIFPKDYLNWYLSPVDFIKSNFIGKYIIKLEHTYIMVTLILVICFLIDNIRSYRKLCELAKHLEDFEQSCPICLEDLITPNEEAERIKCGHFFHNSCLSKWFMRQEEFTVNQNYTYTCPCCRHPLS
ncbi:zinc finger, C3HC4 type (RING finger) protein (macronuclear) [Tetrahymena thermophila SB210]|uniref:Zinc finger, C3HC4 type (RING finger) protein n=1 Tax=Tetrahymena thermophila (strain SB210) TaxID=312017 RepID=A4VDY5_TETTS|nr:zinc finger, C3HC4 type (RING finger) protein [Tetrahymena thermophila SB210]EDK31734.2 zinc finger, C3HC4 type (RING finger) protein [Tetrahymena thermophila SB210]|eukprot:XP_001471341.2 zinc finger, C3HC4 type (RING finger) protein [Tetrahymena thermophila SB210]